MKNKNINTYHKLPILDGLELLNAQNHTTSFPFHSHDSFNIALILNQTFNTKLNDKFLQAPIGTLSITNPNEVHATPCDGQIGNSFFTFYVSPDVLKSINNNNLVFFDDRIIYDETLFQTFYFLSQNFANSQIDFEAVLFKTLEKLVRHHASKNNFKPQETKLFKRFMEDDPFKRFSLEYTAKSFGLDKYKFLRLFKEETGLTPNNYVILKRIERCKKLLLETDLDLLEIALETGFCDSAHLCKHFKKFTGVTPLEYRS